MKTMDVTANIQLDGVPVNPVSDLKVRKQIAFVEQQDTLHIAATPREAIRFSARLRLPASTTTEELDTLTESTIAELGLESCADTIVGGEMLKGISGGERKRTSIGVELVTQVSQCDPLLFASPLHPDFSTTLLFASCTTHQPSLIFLDEPTSGLASTRQAPLRH